MKKNFSLFLASLFLFVITTTLMAQQVHVGTKNQYPIGNSNVSSKVFLFFLQQQSIQGYADDAFMTSPDNWLGNSKASIQYEGKAPNFTYSLIFGHDEDIIDAVNSTEIQKQFNEWYTNWINNPTRQEACDYFCFKLLAYFWAHDGQKMTSAPNDGQKTMPEPTIYFNDQGYNVTQKHQFIVPKDSSNPNHDHAVVGADAISKFYEDAANKIAAQYPHATFWQASRHECPIFMNGHVRLWQTQAIPLANIFGLLNLLLEEKSNPSIQVTKQDVTQQQDGFDCSPFNSSAPIPGSFIATVYYNNAFLGTFHHVAKNDISKSGDTIKNEIAKDSTSSEAPIFDPTEMIMHDQFCDFFNRSVEPEFIAPAIIKFGTFQEFFTQSAWMPSAPININAGTILIDPMKGWMRDTYHWDLFGVMYDALDLQGN